MRHFRNMFFALAAFLWLPASAHCQLECIPGLEYLQCPADRENSPGHCEDDGCCSVEKSHYKGDEFRVPIPALNLQLTPPVAGANLAGELLVQTDLVTIAAVPPELPKCWQFVFRTASPPRAPSSAS